MICAPSSSRTDVLESFGAAIAGLRLLTATSAVSDIAGGITSIDRIVRAARDWFDRELESLGHGTRVI